MEAAFEGPTWRPTPKQHAFLGCPALEALYGGAVGGGKTEALLFGALRNVGHPGFRALILRRTFPELVRDLIPLSQEWYPYLGGVYNVSNKCWRFPSGAVIEFGHLEGDKDVHAYHGLEAQYLAFDELTTFTKHQYTYLQTRLRSSHGIPVRVRAGTNPGGEGHEWVLEYWAPWLRANDPSYDGVRANPGEVLYYLPNKDGQIDWVPKGTPGALSRVFFPAKLTDNPHLMKNDPGYENRLYAQQDAMTREQLLKGNWLAQPGKGTFFKRAWFEIVDAAPAEVLARTRHWDFAASVEGLDKKGKPTDPDWTAGLKLSVTAEGVWFVEHVKRFRGRPGEVKQTVLSYADTDGRQCRISIPQDPGQAGIAQVEDYTRCLAGYVIHARKETGEKVDRARPVSAQAEARNIKVVRGDWNEAFFAEAEAFPEGKKDQIDAFSGAFTDIIDGGYVTIGGTITAGSRRGSEPVPVSDDDDDEDYQTSYVRGGRR